MIESSTQWPKSRGTPVQHQDQLTASGGIKTGFENMHPEAVDVVDEPRPDARWQDGGFERFHWRALSQRKANDQPLVLPILPTARLR
jgi:hypothetical protein